MIGRAFNDVIASRDLGVNRKPSNGRTRELDLFDYTIDIYVH